jgi:hypothetical protein
VNCDCVVRRMAFNSDTYDDPMHLSINCNTNEHEVVIKDIMLQR